MQYKIYVKERRLLMKGIEKIIKIAAIVILVPIVSLSAFIIVCEITGRHFKSDEIAKVARDYSSVATTTNTMSSEAPLPSEQTLQEEDISKTEEGKLEMLKQLAQEALDEPMTNTSSEETSSETQVPNLEQTMSQKNVLGKTKDYLNYMAFSHDGLITQLEFDGFSNEDATYAADNCGADWKEQSIKKANEYLNYAAFSHSGLIVQLEFDKFTNEQATYASDNCGADWNKQAAIKAQDYLNYSSFSSSGLIEQLEFDGFTAEQAKYGVSAVGY